MKEYKVTYNSNLITKVLAPTALIARQKVLSLFPKVKINKVEIVKHENNNCRIFRHKSS